LTRTRGSWRSTALPLLLSAWRALTDRNGHEVVVGDRILVLLPKEPLINEHVDVGRIRVGELSLEQSDRVHVLFAAKDELLLLFARRGLPPDWHGDGEHDGHDRHRHQERGHRVSRLPIRRSLGLTG